MENGNGNLSGAPKATAEMTAAVTGSRAEMTALYYSTLIKQGVPESAAIELTKHYISDFFKYVNRIAEEKVRNGKK